MMKRRYRKALAVLALAACLWALPAAAQNAGAPAVQTAEIAAQSEPSAGAGGLTTTTGGAALVGMGAYSYWRRQQQEERSRKRAEPGEVMYFENHTRNGTLRPEERDRLE